MGFYLNKHMLYSYVVICIGFKMSVFRRISKLVGDVVKRRPEKVYVGKDFDGNFYYEIPPQKYFFGLLSHTQLNRVVEPPSGITDSFYGRDAHTLKVTHEWEAWLRKKRSDPPTLEEIAKNINKYNQVQMRISALEEKAAEERAYLEKSKTDSAPAASSSKSSKESQNVDSWTP